ncbi:effector-associated domain 2-containing protein [Streptomyces sp. DSM 15324]|uniref:VMAP-C domain-containing protein n=1 Tax=Streptomyces sp. DSM 15324 TaxID=1739111 RepID=UPI0007478B0A|nr:trypsin-like peptidase domain-containing protein [Streptomyces sp. DSM 15324]KUO12809.1 hypothetical protein AQJ58_08500 [Streptomyces sp. DSM 15324]
MSWALRDGEPWRVRIQGDDGPPAGCGFLVTPSLVLTCAHVVTAALGVSRYSENGPRGPLWVVRSGTGPGERLAAHVVPGGWVPLRESSGDLALLSVDLPLGTAPRIGTARSGDPVRVLTPDGGLPGVVDALPGADEPDGWGRLTFRAEAPGPGSSGSPVVDGRATVVGLLTAVEATPAPGGSGRFLPLSTVLERIPVPSRRPTGPLRRPGDGLSSRERGELVEALLAVPAMRDPSAFVLLTRELRHEVPAVAALRDGIPSSRLRALELVRLLMEHPEGLRPLVEVLRVYEPGSSAVEAFATLVDKVAPSPLRADERGTLHRLLTRAEPAGTGALLERARDLEDRGAPPVLLDFVARLADRVPGEVGAELQAWRRSVAARLGVEPPPDRTTEPPVLVIAVDPDVWAPETHHVTVSARAADGTTTSLATHHGLAREELGAVLAPELHRFLARTAVPSGPAGRIEFVLPFRLLDDLRVEEWDIGHEGVRRPLGAHHTVVVRCAELQDRESLRWRWQERWSRLKVTPPAERAPVWLDGADSRVLLLDAEQTTFRSSGDPVAACLLQGIPVVIWSKGASPQTEEELTDLARTVPLEAIPEAVRSLRSRHSTTGTRERVGLLFADPEHALPEGGR